MVLLVDKSLSIFKKCGPDPFFHFRHDEQTAPIVTAPVPKVKVTKLKKLFRNNKQS